MSEDHTTGGCLCGAVRYRALGAPESVNACYCRQCQRQTGSPLPSWISYPRDRFELLSGEPATYRSSRFAVRQFCATCGTVLFWRGDAEAGIDILLGTLDRPNELPPPTFAIWTVHRVPWLDVIPGATEYPEGKPKNK